MANNKTICTLFQSMNMEDHSVWNYFVPSDMVDSVMTPDEINTWCNHEGELKELEDRLYSLSKSGKIILKTRDQYFGYDDNHVPKTVLVDSIYLRRF